MTKTKIAVRPSNGENKLKKVSQSFGCLLLFGVLLNFGSCNGLAGLFKGGAHPLAKMNVYINNCGLSSSQNQLEVPVGTDLIWHSDRSGYLIAFDKKWDLNTNPSIPTDITPASVSVPANGTNHWDTTNTSIDCGIVNTTTGPKKTGCYYKYNISYAGSSGICNDPGVHVTPN